MIKEHEEVIQTIEKVGEGINKRLDVLNGSVAKHEARFGSQDVLNAQMTMSQSQIVSDLSILKNSEKETTDFRLKTIGSIDTFKWLIGLIGIGTLLSVIKAFFWYESTSIFK